MKPKILIVILLLSTLSFAQDKKKLLKIFDFDLIELPAEQDYELIPVDDLIFHEAYMNGIDTSGVSNGTEFILFEDSVSFYQNELFKLVRTDYVSNAEYKAFIDHCIDSISREKIYLNTAFGPKKKHLKLFSLPAYYIDPKDSVRKKLDINDPELYYYIRRIAHFNYDFDWRKKFDKKLWRPLLTDFRFRPNERFYGMPDMDTRKLGYKLNIPEHQRSVLGLETDYVMIYPDVNTWAKNSEHLFDVHYILAEHYFQSDVFDPYPVQGLKGTQIKAYLIYLEDQYQKQINDKGLPYRIRLSLPSTSDIEKVSANNTFDKVRIDNESDYLTKKWRITNKDYKEFCNWVADSIILERLYLEMAIQGKYKTTSKMLNTTKTYYDEFQTKYFNFDPEQPFINRGLFHLNHEFNWKKKIPDTTIQRVIKKLQHQDGSIKANLNYKLYWKDRYSMSIEGNYIRDTTDMYEESRFICETFPGKSRDQYNGIWVHYYLAPYIIEEHINIYPNVICQNCKEGTCKWQGRHFPDYDFESDPKGLVEGLTYIQAWAFYNWKYHRKSILNSKKEDWHFDFMPSKTQFEKIQTGQEIEDMDYELEYPDPQFRYVIHVYPKN